MISPSLAQRVSAHAQDVMAARNMLWAMTPTAMPHVRTWIDTHYPWVPAVEALQRLIEMTPEIRWTYDWIGIQLKFGFEDEKYAVMFRLMLP